MYRYYTDDELETCLLQAFNDRPKGSDTISRPWYQEYSRTHFLPDGYHFPTDQAFIYRFGSWGDALRSYGMPVNALKEGMGMPRYTDEELIGYLRKSLRLQGKLSAGRYDNLSRERNAFAQGDEDRWPSLKTVRDRFGSWQEAKNVLEESEEVEFPINEPAKAGSE